MKYYIFLEEMPSTVTVLDTPDGGKIYLVGTAHFSIKSQEDVSRVRFFWCMLYKVFSINFCFIFNVVFLVRLYKK